MAQQAQRVLPTPVDWDELYPGRFLKATELKGKQVTLTIAAVKIEELVGDKGPQIKGVISFEKTDKQWALNKTNGICLKEMFGKKVQEWVGKRVTLHPALWDGEECIRVYGSPDIDREREIQIALPRKRPFNMTMHKVGSKPAAVPAADNLPYFSEDSAIKAMREADSLDALEKLWVDIKVDFKASGRALPDSLEMVYTGNRDKF